MQIQHQRVNNGDALNAGIVLKEATDVNLSSPWNSFNGISSTNISGFTALPGGYRRNDNGNYDKMNYYGHFWIAGEDAVNNTISYVRLDYDSNEFHTYVVGSMVNNSPPKNYGFSVRCIKHTPCFIANHITKNPSEFRRGFLVIIGYWLRTTTLRTAI